MQKQRILVTGGSGFIGSALVERIVEEGNKPYVLIRSTTNNYRLKNIADHIILEVADLNDFNGLKVLIDKIQPKLVYHLAGEGVYSYTDFSRENSGALFTSNTFGTMNLLYALHDIPYELFINTGSCFEYGSREEPFAENDMPAPCNMYGVTKNAATLFAQTYAKNYNKPVVTVRPFTVYGPGEDSSRFISTTIRRCLDGQNPTLTKTGTVRDYIYIDDCVDAYLKTYEYKEQINGEIINIATGIGSPLRHVAEEIITLTGNKSLHPSFGTFPTRMGEVQKLIGNPEKAKRLLHWQAKISLAKGLRKMFEWIKRAD